MKCIQIVNVICFFFFYKLCFVKYTVTQEKEKTWLNVYNKENISNLEEG